MPRVPVEGITDLFMLAFIILVHFIYSQLQINRFGSQKQIYCCAKLHCHSK